MPVNFCDRRRIFGPVIELANLYRSGINSSKGMNLGVEKYLILAIYDVWDKSNKASTRQDDDSNLRGTCNGQKFPAWVQGNLVYFELNVRRM